MRRLVGCMLFLATCAQAAPALFAEAEVSQPSPLVQTQVVYTLRFFQGADVRDIAFHPPQARLASMQALGPLRTREAMRDGKRYRLLERDFALIPFASGKVALAEAHVSGKLPGTSTTTRWTPAPVEIIVRPVPLDADAARWLPAFAVRLSEHWAPLPDSLRPGDSLRRTLRCEAEGVDAAQLPEFALSLPGASVLPHPPVLTTRVVGQRLVASREQTFDIVPTQAGTLLIPALALPWWQVERNLPLQAMLPERHLEIIGISTTESTDAPQVIPPQVPLLVLASAFLFLGAWRLRYLLRLWLSLFRRDTAATCDAMLAWAEQRWPSNPPRTLPELAARLEHASALAVRRLDRQLYGNARAGVIEDATRASLAWPRARPS